MRLVINQMTPYGPESSFLEKRRRGYLKKSILSTAAASLASTNLTLNFLTQQHRIHGLLDYLISAEYKSMNL